MTGHAEDGPIAAEAINRALDGVRHEKAVHLCYGNYGGQTIQKGTYRRVRTESVRRPVLSRAIIHVQCA